VRLATLFGMALMIEAKESPMVTIVSSFLQWILLETLAKKSLAFLRINPIGS